MRKRRNKEQVQNHSENQTNLVVQWVFQSLFHGGNPIIPLEHQEKVKQLCKQLEKAEPQVEVSQFADRIVKKPQPTQLASVSPEGFLRQRSNR